MLRRSLLRATKDNLLATALQTNQALTLSVERRGDKGLLQKVTAEDLPLSSHVDCLYVTVSLVSQPTPHEGSPSSDDDAAASDILVDLSLSGCCGVRSTFGGLVISSSDTTTSSTLLVSANR